jgi:hypothetical protein
MSKKAKRILVLLNDPRQKDRLTDAINRDTMDAAAPVGNGEMSILKDLESPDQEHGQHMENLKSGSRGD